MTEGSAGLVSDTVISRGLDGPNEVPQNSELTQSVKSSEDVAWLREQVKVARDEINKVRKKHQGLIQQHRKDLKHLGDQVEDLRKLSLGSKPLNGTADGSSNGSYCEVATERMASDIFPIGTLTSSWFKEKNGTPRQPSLCREAVGIIDLGPDMARHFPKMTNVSHALENLQEFSHVWIIFIFHKSCSGETNGGGTFTKAKVAPPRLGGSKVGLFSTRSPHRPNLIGLTLAKLELVEGTRVHVSGIDLIEGTPVLDIKPYIPEYDKPRSTDGDIKVSSWIRDNSSSLDVHFTKPALESLLDVAGSPEKASSLETAIRQILAEDPRSVYRKEKCSDQLYFFNVNHFHVTSWFDGRTVQVLKVQRRPKSES